MRILRSRIATPTGAVMMMQLGGEGVFVGSGIIKSSSPVQRAEAVIKATTLYDDRRSTKSACFLLSDRAPRREGGR